MYCNDEVDELKEEVDDDRSSSPDWFDLHARVNLRFHD